MYGSAVSKKVLIPEGAEVTIGPQSYLKIEFPSSGARVAFGSNTTIKLSPLNAEEAEQVSLIKGIARWVSGKLSKKGSGIITPHAVMGIRGTNFFVSTDTLLAESEVICFEGEVHFESATQKSDTKIIKMNQWGGLGGRFGAKIAPVLDLPPNVITHFKSLLE